MPSCSMAEAVRSIRADVAILLSCSIVVPCPYTRSLSLSLSLRSRSMRLASFLFSFSLFHSALAVSVLLLRRDVIHVTSP